MEIGTEQPAKIVEPLEDPFKRTAPARPAPAPTPVKVPEKV